MSTVSNLVRKAMRKLAFVPLTPAAQDAMAGGMPAEDPNAMPPMDPAMTQGGGMPPMPPQVGDPAMAGGMPPQGGQIQTVPGPNGEPIDPETGFIVVDPQQGIEQDPLTGILFSKFTGEFATPDGQPIPPDQAQAMIEDAMAQQGGMPAGDPGMSMPPQVDPAMMQGGGMPPAEDPAMASQQAPVIDDQTGLPLDPETGYYASGAESLGQEQSGEMIPGLEQFIAKAEKVNDRQDKAIKRMTSEMVGTRTDIQGLKREIEQTNDNQDTILARMENILALLESVVGRVGGVQPIRGQEDQVNASNNYAE